MSAIATQRLGDAPGAGPAPGPELAPGPPLPHETVFARLRERNAAAVASSEVVSAQERIELPVPAKRSDAFTGASKYLTAGRENGWSDLATYTRVRSTSAKGAVRYVATIAIRWQRPDQRVIGYWRTGSTGRYVFAFAKAWHRRGPLGPFGPMDLSARGVAVALALPAEAEPEQWRAALAPHQPSPIGPDEGPDGPEAA